MKIRARDRDRHRTQPKIRRAAGVPSLTIARTFTIDIAIMTKRTTG